MFERILVALKFAPASEYALTKGAQLARAHGAELHVLHVMDLAWQRRGEQDPELAACREEVAQRYAAKIDPFVGDLGRIVFSCLPSDPAMQVCRTATDIGADLIVLGCHQPLRGKCLGRIDYIGMTILEKAPCAVMMIPFWEQKPSRTAGRHLGMASNRWPSA